MKKIELINLTLSNFKGIKNKSIDFNGKDANIFGRNGSGKTTLEDGFNWLLFGKDSNNRSDFAIKTLNEQGEEIGNVEHGVEGTLKVDGSLVVLKRVYREVWTKKMGEAIERHTGHTTDYYINGVPKKQGEYNNMISSIVQEDVFKLLTSPSFFNEQMKWQDRRNTLLEVSGDVDFDDVLAFNTELRGLPAVLHGRTIDDHKAIITARRSEIKKELDRIPIRIDEIYKSMPEEVENTDGLQAEVEGIEKELDENATQINNIRNGTAIMDRKQKIQQLDMQITDVKRKHESGSQDAIHRLRTRIQEEQSNRSILESKKKQAQQQVDYTVAQANKVIAIRGQLREEFDKENTEQFIHSAECTCPSCGQDLPESQLQEARQKAEDAFNLSKSRKLEFIRDQGKTANHQLQQLNEENEREKANVIKWDEQIADKDKSLTKLQNELQGLQNAVIDISTNEEYISLVEEKVSIQNRIAGLQQNASEAIQGVEKHSDELRARRSILNAQIARQAHLIESKKRIGELEEQQQELAEEYSNLSQQSHLLEVFIRTKVDLLNEKINQKFNLARFRLFKKNVNGGIEEICETLYQGVDYSKGLNNAAKINVGIDIIDTLQRHYGIRVPIFTDNAESVTDLLKVDTQMISLIVSKDDEKLRVELK